MPGPDPYRNLKFKLFSDGTAVAGLSKVSGLTRSTEEIRSRDVPLHTVPGVATFTPLVLERGITHDVEFVD